VEDRSLRVLSWNAEGLNESQLGKRMEKLCLEILIGGDLAAAMAGRPTPPMPHVVTLQEVVRVAQRGYFAPHFRSAGYALWPDGPPGESDHYELIAVRPPWEIEHVERRPFTDSPLGRACTIARLRATGSGERVTVMTAHLESLRSGHEPRLAQCREIDRWMREGELAVFAGDTNLRESEWAAVKGEVAMRDAFVEAGSPPAARITWRPEDDARGFRFDRIWLAGAIAVKDFRLRSCPRASDHEGVEARLALG
jgi:endonuclease/exonuclease/phosphatase family metal-dependent hydrolase